MGTDVELTVVCTEAHTVVLFAHQDNRSALQTMALFDSAILQYIAFADQLFDLLPKGRRDVLKTLQNRECTPCIDRMVYSQL